MKKLILGFIEWRKDVKHDKERERKLVLYKLFGFRDPKFDYKQHLKGSFWDYVRGTIGQRADLKTARKMKTVNDYRKATKGL